MARPFSIDYSELMNIKKIPFFNAKSPRQKEKFINLFKIVEFLAIVDIIG
jgi:hypothetical protein